VGCPQFEEGQRALLFLTPDRGEAYRVLGYQQGHYMIRKNADGRDEAVSTVDGVSLAVTPEGQTSYVPKTIELTTFKAELRAEAARLRDVRQ
ncbi:MAG: hypothetical protein GY856_35565, partial [bacterium]|nr:hypothetical protein [bacterium]